MAAGRSIGQTKWPHCLGRGATSKKIGVRFASAQASQQEDYCSELARSAALAAIAKASQTLARTERGKQAGHICRELAARESHHVDMAKCFSDLRKQITHDKIPSVGYIFLVGRRVGPSVFFCCWNGACIFCVCGFARCALCVGGDFFCLCACLLCLYIYMTM